MKKFFSVVFILVILLSISASAFAVSLDLTVGQSVPTEREVIYSLNKDEKFASWGWSGAVPDGLFIEIGESTLSLKGTPTTAGHYSFVLELGIKDADENVTTRQVEVKGEISEASAVVTASPEITSTPSVSDAAMTITKHPGAENRLEGGYAIFIAKATGASDCTWTFVSTDGGMYPLETFKTKFPSVIVTVANNITDGELSSTVTLENIPKDISGYSAYAEFSDGNGATLKTSSASVTVTAATPSPAPTTAPTPTPSFTATPIPTLTPVAETPSPVPTVAPTERIDDTQVISHKGAGAGTIIATILVGLFTVAVAVILVLYMKGKLDLGWLEEMLEKKTDKDQRDDD